MSPFFARLFCFRLHDPVAARQAVFFVGIQLANTSCSIWWSCQTTLSLVYLGGAKTPGLQYLWCLPYLFWSIISVRVNRCSYVFLVVLLRIVTVPRIFYPIFACFAWGKRLTVNQPTGLLRVSPWGLVSTWKMRVTTMMATSAASGSWSSPMLVPWVKLNSLPKGEPKGSLGYIRDEKSGWWFQIFFIFTPTWGNDPIWLIFFKWIETTN